MKYKIDMRGVIGLMCVLEVKLKIRMMSFQSRTLCDVFPYGTTRLHLRKT